MSPWTPLAPVLLMLFSFSLRRLSPAGGWLHTSLGATAIAFTSGLGGALAQAIQAHGFSSATIAPAIASFVMSFLATANPSLAAAAKTEEPAMRPSGSSLRALLPFLLMPALAMSGCVTMQKQTMMAEFGLGKTVSLGYRAVDGIDKAKTDALHNEILAGMAAHARVEFDAYKPKIDKALAGLAAGADLLATVDTMRQAADKGQRDWKDFTAYLPQLASMVAQVEALIADLKAVAQ